MRVLRYWPRDRSIELAPNRWRATASGGCVVGSHPLDARTTNGGSFTSTFASALAVSNEWTFSDGNRRNTVGFRAPAFWRAIIGEDPTDVGPKRLKRRRIRFCGRERIAAECLARASLWRTVLAPGCPWTGTICPWTVARAESLLNLGRWRWLRPCRSAGHDASPSTPRPCS
jgi:hypothetical protein